MSWLIGNPPSSPSTKGAKIQRPGPSSSHCPSLVRPTGRIVSPSPCLPTMANPVPGPARTFDCTRTLAVMASREGSGVSVAGTVVGVGDGAGVGVQVGTATGACCAWEADGAGAWTCWRPGLDWPRPQPVRSAPATRIVKPRSRCSLSIDRFMSSTRIGTSKGRSCPQTIHHALKQYQLGQCFSCHLIWKESGEEYHFQYTALGGLPKKSNSVMNRSQAHKSPCHDNGPRLGPGPGARLAAMPPWTCAPGFPKNRPVPRCYASIGMQLPWPWAKGPDGGPPST